MESIQVKEWQDSAGRNSFAITSYLEDSLQMDNGQFTGIGERIVSTFFEYEMDFPFINTITGLKNMEDYIQIQKIPIKEGIDKRYIITLNNQLFMTTNNNVNQN